MGWSDIGAYGGDRRGVARCSSPLWIYVLFLLGQSVILTYGTNLARFGILTPSAPIPFELVMALGGLAVALVLIVATGGRLAYREEPAEDSIVTVGPR